MNTHNRNELIKCIQDEKYFIETYVMDNHPVHGLSTVKLTEKQLAILEQIKNKTIIIDAIPERQIGTSFMLVAHTLWLAIFNSYQNIHLMGVKVVGAQELRMRFRIAYEHLPDFLKPARTVDNKYEIAFDHGTVVYFTTSNPSSLKGRPLNHLLLDTFDEFKAERRLEIYNTAPSGMVKTDLVQLVIV